MSIKVRSVNRGKMFKVGIGIIALSLTLWIGPLVIPFTALSISQKVSLTVALLVIAEILFWIGAFFVGREYADRIKSWFDPRKWSKR